MTLLQRACRKALTGIRRAIRLHGERGASYARRVAVEALAGASAFIAVGMEIVGRGAAGQNENEDQMAHLASLVARSVPLEG